MFVLLLLQFEKTVLFFGEDPKQVSLDEFFAIFDSFLTSFLVSITVYCFDFLIADLSTGTLWH